MVHLKNNIYAYMFNNCINYIKNKCSQHTFLIWTFHNYYCAGECYTMP